MYLWQWGGCDWKSADGRKINAELLAYNSERIQHSIHTSPHARFDQKNSVLREVASA